MKNFLVGTGIFLILFGCVGGGIKFTKFLIHLATLIPPWLSYTSLGIGIALVVIGVFFFPYEPVPDDIDGAITTLRHKEER